MPHTPLVIRNLGTGGAQGMARYRVAQHAYVCRVDDQAVVLDLRNDEYLAIGTAELNALRELVLGWPVDSREPCEYTAVSESDLALLLRTLTEKGLLVADPATGKAADSPRVDPVTAEPAAAFGQIPAIEGRHIRRFLFAWLVASLKLRLWSIERIVRHTQKRKQRALLHKREVTSRETLSNSTIEPLVGIFYRMRPFLFTASQACLLHSLVLVEFLAQYRVYPTWTFGVKMQPFAAHCWVQEGPVILNGSAQYARKFVPIMAI